MNGATNNDKTHQVAQLILANLLEGASAPGDLVPTEREMALRSGTSRVTVRRAYAELERVGILERRQGHGTRIATAVRGSREPLTHVAVVMDVAGPYGVSLLRSLEAEAGRLDALLVLKLNARESHELESAVLDLARKNIRHLIVWPGDGLLNPGTVQRLRILGTNMVFFDRFQPGVLADYVGLDNRAALGALLDHAWQQGCRTFDFVGYEGDRPLSETERADAFCRWCKQRKVSGNVCRVSTGAGRMTQLAQAIGQGLGRGANRGVVAVHDSLAMEVAGALGDAARVYGVDGNPAAMAMGITTVCQPLEKMAKIAFRLLKEQHAKGDRWRARTVRCAGQLVSATNGGGT